MEARVNGGADKIPVMTTQMCQSREPRAPEPRSQDTTIPPTRTNHAIAVASRAIGCHQRS